MLLPIELFHVCVRIHIDISGMWIHIDIVRFDLGERGRSARPGPARPGTRLVSTSSDFRSASPALARSRALRPQPFETGTANTKLCGITWGAPGRGRPALDGSAELEDTRALGGGRDAHTPHTAVLSVRARPPLYELYTSLAAGG